MTELKMTHVLLLAVAAFLMYHFIGGCGFNRGDGFNVGGQVIKTESCGNNLSNNCSNQNIISNNQLLLNEQLSSLDTKVDTLTNRFDEFLCQIIDSEKCIDKTKIGNCKISN
tara:strand:+ start:324 stop:659 length:336 start_codon:yes stop_codon:yes gene_type:complete